MKTENKKQMWTIVLANLMRVTFAKHATVLGTMFTSVRVLDNERKIAKENLARLQTCCSVAVLQIRRTSFVLSLMFTGQDLDKDLHLD